MIKRPSSWFAAIGLSLLLFSLPVWAQQRPTHLNVAVDHIANLETQCLTNDNTPQSFTYDRGTEPFSVSSGYSFVITDITIYPCGNPNQTDTTLAVVTIGSGRNFTVSFFGAITKHYALTSGLVVPEGVTLEARSTNLSSNLIDVQIMGYFVKGAGLPVDKPFQPN